MTKLPAANSNLPVRPNEHSAIVYDECLTRVEGV
jgi:hypothetical protein